MQPINYEFNASLICVSDRAFNYGDGCFTTMLCIEGRIQLLKRHVSRLLRDCERLSIPVYNLDNLTQYLSSKDFMSALNAHAWCAVKVFISRGVGGRGYATPPVYEQEPKIVVSVSQYNRTLLVHTLNVSSVVLSKQPLLAGIKHANRLEQVFAKQALNLFNESADLHADDSLLCDEQAHIIEATSSNLFFKSADAWITPKLNNSGVSGVMRDFIMSQASELECNILEQHVELKMLEEMSSAFMCNALSGVVPIGHIALTDKTIEFDVRASLNLRERVDKLMMAEM